MYLSNDHSLHIGVDKLSRDDEFFTKDIKRSVTANKPNKDDSAVRNVIQTRYLGIWPQPMWAKLIALSTFIRCFTL